MARTKRVLPEGVKVRFETVTGRPRGRGSFAIEEEGDEVARQAKLQRMAKRIAEYDLGMKEAGGGVRNVGSGNNIKGTQAERSVWRVGR